MSSLSSFFWITVFPKSCISKQFSQHIIRNTIMIMITLPKNQSWSSWSPRCQYWVERCRRKNGSSRCCMARIHWYCPGNGDDDQSINHDYDDCDDDQPINHDYDYDDDGLSRSCLWTGPMWTASMAAAGVLCSLLVGRWNDLLYSRHLHQLWLLLSPRMIIRVTFILPTSFSLPEPMSTNSAVKEHPLLLCQLRWNFFGKIFFKVYCFNFIWFPRRVTWECCPSFSPTEQIPLSKITMAEILTGWLWEITMLPLQVVILWNRICIRDKYFLQAF